MDDITSREVAIWNELRARLEAEYGDADEQTIFDTLDGETNLIDRLVWLAKQAKRDERYAEALKAEKQDIDARKARFETRADKQRNLIAWAMQEIGKMKIEAPALTLSCREGKPKLIINAERLSDKYKKTEIKLVPDKEIIQAAVERGDVPEGVEIANPQPVLTIRTK
jgi:hypothetical protein